MNGKLESSCEFGFEDFAISWVGSWVVCRMDFFIIKLGYIG